MADIFRAEGQAFRETHDLTPDQRQVMGAIENCRTAILGGHREECDHCGHVELAYNSCRNRHCPKCQALSQARWINQRSQRVVPTHYFHVVFTLPQELRPLAFRNPSAIFDLLFKSAAQTLLELGGNPRWLGGMLGLSAVLHTWTRELHFHPHLHCLVTGGALDIKGEKWIPAKPDFLFPVRVLSHLYRGKLLAGLRRLYETGQLDLTGRSAHLQERKVFARLLDQLFRKQWVVYEKPPFGGPEQTLRYLGRYTHRVGLSNHRLLAFEDGQVTFATKNGKNVTVRAQTFIQRFLLHVLPKGYVKIRHYGILAASHATTTLEKVRELIKDTCPPADSSAAAEADPYEELTWKELYRLLTGDDLTLCPRCHQGRLVPTPLGRNLEAPDPKDTS